MGKGRMEQDMMEKDRRGPYTEGDGKISQATKGQRQKDEDRNSSAKETPRALGCLCTGSQMLLILSEIATLLWLENGEL